MTKTITFENKGVYKDFDLSFSNNPLTNDVSIKNDIQAINQSLRSLVLTNYYERPFNPTIGCNIRKILFEPMDQLTMLDLRDAIKYTIENYERRVRLIEVRTQDLPEQNAYHVNVIYEIRATEYQASFDTVLKRLR